MKHTLTVLAAALSLSAQAADLTFTGQIVNHNDKVVIDFQVAAGQQVAIWTDSWLLGFVPASIDPPAAPKHLNFDPQIFVASGDAIIASDDDGSPVNLPPVGGFDAGLQFTAPAAGSYRLVLNAASNNALGGLLSQGFSYDADAPIQLVEWNQPSYDSNANDQKGGFWSIHLNGVEQAAVVPEPAGWALLMAGLLMLGSLGRRRL